MSRIQGYNGPINRNPKPDEARIIIYNYYPSLAFGIVGAVTFGLAFLLHSFHWFKGKGSGTKVYQFLLLFGCVTEVVGYAFRIRSHYRPFVVNSFVVQYFMIVVSPVFFTAAIYLSLSIAARRVANAGYGNILPVRPKLLVTIFIISDVLTTALQIAGAALVGVSASAQARGEQPSLSPTDANHILLAGLAVQCFSFLLFLIFLGLALKNWPARKSVKAIDSEKSSTAAFSWYYPLAIVISSLLVWLRTLYRLGETAEGVFGPAYSSETLFAVLEYLPVILALIVLGALPLRKTLPYVT